jgi:hypothetical protein
MVVRPFVDDEDFINFLAQRVHHPHQPMVASDANFRSLIQGRFQMSIPEGLFLNGTRLM